MNVVSYLYKLFYADSSPFSGNCMESLPTAEDIKNLYLNTLLVQSLTYTPTLMEDSAVADRFRPNTANDNGFVYLFNNNPFSTPGLITSWVFAARKRKTDSSTNRESQFPQLQIWRPRSTPDGAISSYDQHFTTTVNSRPPILLGALNMYTLELDPPASYEPNDIIGIYQPSSANATLQIAFVDSDDTVLRALVQPTTLARTGRFVNEESASAVTVLPLMTLASKSAVTVEPSRAVSSTSSSVSITSSRVLHSTTLTNTEPSISRLENEAIIGVAVGVLGSIALLMFVIILLLALCIAKKKRNRKNFVAQNNLPLLPISNQAAYPFGNPTYTGGMEPKERYQSILVYYFNTYSKLSWDWQRKPCLSRANSNNSR